MRIFVDTTEPGQLFHVLARKAQDAKITVQRSILHKRVGLGGSARERHPFYGLGADFVITDNELVPAAAIERKSFEDLARSITLQEGGSTKMFRQLHDLAQHPCPILLIEGPVSALYRHMEPASIGIQFWCARQGISVVTTTSPIASAHAVFLIARKLGQELEGLPPPAIRDDADEISDAPARSA